MHDVAQDGRTHRQEDAETESVLDPAVLADLRQLADEDGGGIIDELIGVFLANAPLRLAAIRDEIAARNAERVSFLAHSLKGLSGVLGARKLAVVCAELEECAGAGLDGRSESLATRLDVEFERARAEFVSICSSLR